jgi:hypothetical protein
MQLNIKADIKAAEKALGTLKKQVPYAAWLAQKNTAFKVRADEIAHMKQVFKKTAPYTLRAPLVDFQKYDQWRAGVDKTMAVDLISQFTGAAGNRTRSRHYLWDHIHGERTHTGFERLLIDKGIMPPGMFAVRTKYLGLFSRGGRVSKGIYTKILSQLKAFKTGRGHDLNATNSAKSKRKRKRGKGQLFYVMTIKGVTGIWMHHQATTGAGAMPLFLFVDKARYSRRFRFYEVAQRSADKHWPVEFNKAIQRAIATAR